MAGDASFVRPKSARGVRAERARVAQHYWAFLSYSHKDAETADWLHQSLEAFRVPPGLVGRLTDNGPVPRKLTPIFRDRHELAAAGDLSAEIEAALAGSRFLIVLCSPAAARSSWTNQEIIGFKRRHPEACVLAAIVDGEPFASDIPGREADECFPEALRIHYDRGGRPTAKRAEPMAADLREDRDGRKLGLLKIVAGMLGLGLDDLVQRDSHRRQRRLALVAGGSVLGMLVSVGLAVTALQARDSAREQRREAEGLIGFMLGDLREKLEPLGRLDILDSVGARALEYYAKQDKENLSDLALAQRSKALTLMGEMANTKGDLDGALARYREALEGTAEAVRRAPDNPQNLFEHAQNVFWVGYIDYQRGNMGKAAVAFREYRRLADRMIELAPNNPDYSLEPIYAATNLGTVLMEQRRYREAADVYQRSLEPVEALLAREAGNKDYQIKLADTLAWLADAREYSGQLDEALAHRQRQLALLERLWSSNEGDTQIKRIEMTARRAIARLLVARGQLTEALAESRRAAAVIDWLTKAEPQNTEWMQAGAQANFERASLELASNQLGQATSAANTACDSAARLIERDRSVAVWRTDMQLSCLRAKILIGLKVGPADEAVPLAREALALARTETNEANRGFAVATAEKMLGDALAKRGQADAALGAYQRALSAWPRNVEEKPRELAERAILLRLLRRQADATVLDERLKAMGYRHPNYMTAIRQGG